MYIVPKSDLYGMRKCKNFDINIAVGSSGAEDDPSKGVVLTWALIYIPEGVVAPVLNGSSDPSRYVSLYEPNQYVLASGHVSYECPAMVKSYLARNLNSNDSVMLAIRAEAVDAPVTYKVSAKVNYAIAL
jgi:hypothetical protein